MSSYECSDCLERWSRCLSRFIARSRLSFPGVASKTSIAFWKRSEWGSGRQAMQRKLRVHLWSLFTTYLHVIFFLFIDEICIVRNNYSKARICSIHFNALVSRTEGSYSHWLLERKYTRKEDHHYKVEYLECKYTRKESSWGFRPCPSKSSVSNFAHTKRELWLSEQAGGEPKRKEDHHYNDPYTMNPVSEARGVHVLLLEDPIPAQPRSIYWNRDITGALNILSKMDRRIRCLVTER